MPRRPDAIVDAAYSWEPDPLWVESLTAAVAGVLDQGLGVHGFVFHPSSSEPLRHPVFVGGTESWKARWRSEWWEPVMLRASPEVLESLIAFAPCSYSSHLWAAVGRERAAFQDMMTELAGVGFGHVFGPIVNAQVPHDAPRTAMYPESFNVVAASPDGYAVVFCANRASRSRRPPTKREFRMWSRVAAHISSAARIRRALANTPVAEPDGELGLSGSTDAIAPEVRAQLREAALSSDRAIARNIRSTDEAFELWRALHRGQWSVVDAFDSQGRRFLVAREHGDAKETSPALSPREQQAVDLLALGHSNKTIAAELGISVSSVATHLRRATAKLGAQSTRELVRWSRSRQGEG